MSLTCSPCFTLITPGLYSYFFAVILISFTPFPACVPAPASCVKAARVGKCESITAVTTKTATALLRSDRFISPFNSPRSLDADCGGPGSVRCADEGQPQ